MATDPPNVIPFPNAEAQAAEFIRKVRDELRDSTAAVDPEELLKILPDIFEQAIALILSELDYERNRKCNAAKAVRLLAVYAVRFKDTGAAEVAKEVKS